jgi:hypothetical protein
MLYYRRIDFSANEVAIFNIIYYLNKKKYKIKLNEKLKTQSMTNFKKTYNKLN